MKAVSLRSAGAAQAAERQVWKGLWKISRPKQWIKNVYVFAALVFAAQIGNGQALLHTVFAFALFCLVASSVYVLNDIVDERRDRLHPRKRLRPIPSGMLPKPVAWTYLAVLVAIWLPLGFQLSRMFGMILLGYFVMNILYSFKLKHIFLLDVMVVAVGFVLRAIGGAVLIHVPVSPWLFVCTVLVSLFLALGKRRNELVTLKGTSGGHRKALEMYSVALVDQFLAIVSGATLLAYSLYSFSASPNYLMMWTIPFVVYGLFRYLYLIHQTDLAGSPEEALLTDLPSIVNVLLWGVAVILMIYSKQLFAVLA